jgi:glutamate dehydrogenase/leucine dehydrogenase
VKHYYEVYGGFMNNKLAIIQGWGNVAAAAAFYLTKYGVRIAGIIDRDGGIIHEQGLGYEEVRELFINRTGNKLNAPNMLSFEEVHERIWDIPAEIFVPGAASRLVTEEQVRRLIKSGIEVVSCGANVPFADKEIFMGPISRLADSQMAVIPDFVANCGMARVFAYLMKKDAVVTDVEIFKDVSNIIRQTMLRLHQFNPRTTGISAKGLELSLTDLV